MEELYRNRKKGTLYRVLHRAVDCTNERDGTLVVVYCSVEDAALVFVRDQAEFLVKFEPVSPADLSPTTSSVP